MLNLLFIALLSTTIISSLHCAEPKETKESKSTLSKFIKTKRSTRSLSSNQLTPTIINAKIHTIAIEHEFLTAVRNKNNQEIQFHLSNPCLKLNMQDEHGNTALHIATNNFNAPIILQLLTLYQVDPTIRNKKLFMAHQLTTTLTVNKDELTPIKYALFRASTIHFTMVKECEQILLTKPQGNITSEEMKQAIQNIKTTITTTESNQDRKLPKKTRLNDSNEDEFIQNKIFYTLNDLKKATPQKNNCSIL